MLTLTDYDYTLPEELIAQHPTLPPENARLLVFDRKKNTICDMHFYDLPRLLPSETLIVFNDSKVVKARIHLPQINGEILFLKLLTPTSFEALVRPGKKRGIGASHTIPLTDITFTVIDTTTEGRILTCSHPILDVLEKYGQMPLPPYIQYDEQDAPHYQPVVANEQKPGSVAAPTAALHFGEHLLQKLEEYKIHRTTVTLHVGIGTFKTVSVEDITTHQIHHEYCEVAYSLFSQIATQKANGKPLLSVGTTSTRTLESLPYLRKTCPDTQKQLIRDASTIHYRNQITEQITIEQTKRYISDISRTSNNETITFASHLYIYPGFQFLLIDQLITNFHLPKSSLLMLVAGFVGFDQMKTIYSHAIQQQYRFFSFGDGMLL